MKTEPKLKEADPSFDCIMVPPPRVKPRIEVGRDDSGKWAVYVEGLPMGMNFHYRKEAKIVADWLYTCDWEAMTKEV